jgi:hypothetical protein
MQIFSSAKTQENDYSGVFTADEFHILDWLEVISCKYIGVLVYRMKLTVRRFVGLE